MSFCHTDHFPYSCDDDYLHQSYQQHPHHHHHHHNHNNWCNAWFHSSCLTGQVSITKEDGFQLQLDVRHFSYDDIKVKTLNEWIMVEGKQSDDNEKTVCITRKFSRKYKLPRNYDSNLIQVSLSSDGILLVKVPPPEDVETEEKLIEIEKTGPFFNKSANGNGNGKGNGKGNEKEKVKEKVVEKEIEKEIPKTDEKPKSAAVVKTPSTDKTENKNAPIKVSVNITAATPSSSVTIDTTATSATPGQSGLTITSDGTDGVTDEKSESLNVNDNISTQNDDKNE